MRVTFYFDPACPFSWITSRWLLVVAAEREIDITWKPFSLAIKNNELQTKPNESEHAESHRESLRMLRVLLEAEANHAVKMIDGYTAAGLHKHIMDGKFSNEGIKQVLDNLGLSESLIDFADNPSADDTLKQNIDEVTTLLGQDIGVPTIVFELQNGKKQGYFGPVLNELPNKNECLQIWDGLSKLATTSSFYELKRSRPSGSPNTASTARC